MRVINLFRKICSFITVTVDLMGRFVALLCIKKLPKKICIYFEDLIPDQSCRVWY